MHQRLRLVDQPPAPFQNCSSIYRSPHDDRYANCSLQLPSYGIDDVCDLLSSMHLTSDYRHYSLIYMPTALSLIAVAVNLSFAIAIVVALRRRSISSKYAHIFLFNRSICNIVAVFVYYVVLLVWNANSLDFSYASTTIFIFIGALSFLSMTGIYLALTALLYIAITQPFWYNASVTHRKCVYVIAVIWLLSIAVASLMGIYGATLFYPESSSVSCDFQTCQRPLAIVIVVIIAVCYLTVIGFYVIILTRIRRRRSGSTAQTQRYESDKRKLTALSKLGLNMFTFAASSLPILVVSIIGVVELDQLRMLGEGDKSKCKNIEMAPLMFRLEALASCGAFVWLVGMIVDPLINCFSDVEFRSFILICIRIRLKTKPIDSSKNITMVSSLNKIEE